MKLCVLGFPRSGTTLLTKWFEAAGMGSLDEVLVPWHHINRQGQDRIDSFISVPNLKCNNFTPVLKKPSEALAKIPPNTVFKHFYNAIADPSWIDEISRECVVVAVYRNPIACLISHYQASQNHAWRGKPYASKQVAIPEKWAHTMMTAYNAAMPLVRKAQADPSFHHVTYTELLDDPYGRIAPIANKIGVALPRELPMNKQGEGRYVERAINIDAIREWVKAYPELEQYVREFE